IAVLPIPGGPRNNNACGAVSTASRAPSTRLTSASRPTSSTSSPVDDHTTDLNQPLAETLAAHESPQGQTRQASATALSPRQQAVASLDIGVGQGPLESLAALGVINPFGRGVPSSHEAAHLAWFPGRRVGVFADEAVQVAAGRVHRPDGAGLEARSVDSVAR